MGKFYSDIHCHSTLRPYNSGKDILYDKDPFIHSDGPIINYSEADFTKLAEGNIRLVFVSLYPIERGFFVSKQLGDDKLDDILISILLRFPPERINQVQSPQHDYFEDLEKEYALLQTIENKTIKARINDGKKKNFKFRIVKSFDEIQQLLNLDTSFETNDTAKDIYICIVLTIEGAHSLGCGSMLTENINPDDLEAPSTLALLNKLKGNITKIKNWHNGNHCPLFFTLSHHFWNQLCGHSISMPEPVYKILDQTNQMNTGFTELGKAVVKELLSTEGGQKRILIDCRHMSITSRKWYFQYLKEQAASGNIIPVISSHSAVNGYPDMTQSTIENQTHEQATEKYKSSEYYNNWDINLSDEEIMFIYHSGGLIGLSFDERIIEGEKQLETCKSQSAGSGKDMRRYIWAEPFVRNILHIANTLLTNGVSDDALWQMIVIGTDFDGMINPVDAFRTSSDLQAFDETLRFKLKQQSQYNPLLIDKGSMEIDEIVNGFMFKNALRFLKRNF